MKIPFQNNSSEQVCLSLEPEGDSIQVPAGETVVVTTEGPHCDTVEVTFEDGVISICAMSPKKVMRAA